MRINAPFSSQEIAELMSNNEDISNQIDEKRKDSDSLQLKITSMEKHESSMEEIIKLHKKDVASQKAMAEKLKSKVEELTEDIESQTKFNESLHGQLNEGLQYRNDMQARVTFLERKFQQVQAGLSSGTETVGPTPESKNINESSETAAPEPVRHDIIELLSSDEEGEDHKVNTAVKTAAKPKKARKSMGRKSIGRKCKSRS